MARRSRLGAIVIDCRGDDLDAAARFWSGALGTEFRLDPDDPRYAVSDTPEGRPDVILQRVEHDSRVHLDIETDDREAERGRLEGFGARLVERNPKGFLVMEAPTGHRFCLVKPQRSDIAQATPEVGR